MASWFWFDVRQFGWLHVQQDSGVCLLREQRGAFPCKNHMHNNNERTERLCIWFRTFIVEPVRFVAPEWRQSQCTYLENALRYLCVISHGGNRMGGMKPWITWHQITLRQMSLEPRKLHMFWIMQRIIFTNAWIRHRACLYPIANSEFPLSISFVEWRAFTSLLISLISMFIVLESCLCAF